MTTLSGAAAKLGNRPTMSGRLHEVDLGEEVRMRNAAMTEQARRRLAGEALDDEAEGSSKRPRIGKDGKPWRPRKRRASEDIKRDQLVEELMRENRRESCAVLILFITGARPAHRRVGQICANLLFTMYSGCIRCARSAGRQRGPRRGRGSR